MATKVEIIVRLHKNIKVKMIYLRIFIRFPYINNYYDTQNNWPANGTKLMGRTLEN